MSTIAQFKALNILRPFTGDAERHQLGMLASLIFNTNCGKKKDMKQPKDLFPFLDTKTPDWLEDERVLKAQQLMNSISAHRASPELYEKSFNHIKNAILEEIEIIRGSDEPCEYTINKLTEIIGDKNGKEDI